MVMGVLFEVGLLERIMPIVTINDSECAYIKQTLCLLCSTHIISHRKIRLKYSSVVDTFVDAW